jgi:hypothetical protein
MFSHRGLPLDVDTLEYAWMIEVGIGDLTGRLTAPQVHGEKVLVITFPSNAGRVVITVLNTSVSDWEVLYGSVSCVPDHA